MVLSVLNCPSGILWPQPGNQRLQQPGRGLPCTRWCQSQLIPAPGGGVHCHPFPPVQTVPGACSRAGPQLMGCLLRSCQGLAGKLRTEQDVSGMATDLAGCRAGWEAGPARLGAAEDAHPLHNLSDFAPPSLSSTFLQHTLARQSPVTMWATPPVPALTVAVTCKPWAPKFPSLGLP